MPKIAYVEKTFNRSSMTTIDQANEIIEEYQAKGFVLTLRQLYYQFVARGHIPNKMNEYKRLASIINDARLAGLVDWEAIEDRTRNVQSRSHWDNPESIIHACAESYHKDMWKGQKFRPEVWIEKEALVGVIERICNEFDVPYFACRGYTSQSEAWRASLRFRRHRKARQTPIILHLGDHDPSGIDMTRDNDDRMGVLAAPLEVRRLALNMDQVEEYNPPPNPAKMTDSRFGGYSERFGEESWELDALDPEVIEGLIRTQLEGLRDLPKWEARQQEIETERAHLTACYEQWSNVVEFLKPEESEGEAE